MLCHVVWGGMRDHVDQRIEFDRANALHLRTGRSSIPVLKNSQGPRIIFFTSVSGEIITNSGAQRKDGQSSNTL